MDEFNCRTLYKQDTNLEETTGDNFVESKVLTMERYTSTDPHVRFGVLPTLVINKTYGLKN